MNIFTERHGILVTEKGTIHLRHNGQLREIKHAEPSTGDSLHPFNMWSVEFTDGTTAAIGQPTMGAALNRRLMECPMDVIMAAPYGPTNP